MSGSLPELMDFYAANKSDRFEILAFHDGSVKTFEELDAKMVKAKASRPIWAGRDLPFPILLDATGESVKQYDVHAFPTTILIDPDGKLVGQGPLQLLKDALAREAAARGAGDGKQQAAGKVQ
jgi:hypothetical protein